MSSTFFDASARLVERFCRGDEAAFDALVTYHRQRVYALVHRMTRDHERAEEITDEVFLETYRALPSFRYQSSFSTWLHRVAVNVCLEQLRSEKARKAMSEVPLRGDDEHLLVDPAEVALGRENARLIAEAIESLEEPQRMTVMLYYLKQLTCAEIAGVLGVPRNTVKTRLFHGTRLLRDKLVANGIVTPPV